ncbi:MAG: four helix bundle protein [Actinomycetia bacterium]|nr:four helix bundle protein [Actinomycetes bacterium]
MPYNAVVHNYQRLQIYEFSLRIAEDTYALTRKLPNSERWGIGQQMNRSAVSIVSNIAEGAGRGDDRDFARFLRIARGSASELEAQAELGTRLGFFDRSETHDFRDRIERIKSSITRLELRLQGE